jgi:hypothetical protein
MKLFTLREAQFDSSVNFPKEGEEYLIDVVDNTSKYYKTTIKCYAICTCDSENGLSFECGYVDGDNIEVNIDPSHSYERLLFKKIGCEEASGSAAPYTPVLKEASYIINPDLCKSHVYKLIFNDKQISDTYGVERINGILIDSGEDFTHHVQNLSFITEFGTLNIAMYDDDGPKIWIYKSNEESFAIDNDKIDVRELK